MANANSTIESAKNSMNAAAHSANAELNGSSSKEKLGEAYKLATEAASDFVEGTKSKAKEQYFDRKNQMGDLTVKAEDYIKEKPLMAIGAAFVAGWAISKILGK